MSIQTQQLKLLLQEEKKHLSYIKGVKNLFNSNLPQELPDEEELDHVEMED